ncbi:hypothetical protein [Xylophilus sp. GOD-11R]|uniref:hypothetical protein n=1 Tax=Xylophilus sp. GOD-11R TaxID=3089814 RepID=UPI00298C062A|nr:hypothetical protein [Xylophilus sp. GOD-11R]WPB56753.1 hypothetical protein R9X41_21870 [Xylophilus sp. GOD-11R]
MLPSTALSATAATSRPTSLAAQAISTGIAAPPTRLEELPVEVHQHIVGLGLLREGHEGLLDVSALRSLNGLNHRLRATFSEQRRALIAMSALDEADDDTSWQAAMALMAAVPPPWRELCRESAWAAFARRATTWNDGPLEREIARQLELNPTTFAPIDRAAPPSPLCRNALRLLLARDNSPSPLLVASLLRQVMAGGPVAPAQWRRLMAQLGESALRWQAAEGGMFALPALGATQNADVAAVLDCAAAAGRVLQPAELARLVQRVERDTSPACRPVALDLLLHGAVAPGVRWEPVLHDAVARLPPADLEKVLIRLTQETSDPEIRGFVNAQSDRLPASAAMRLVDIQNDANFFAPANDAGADHQPTIGRLLDRARGDTAEMRRLLEVVADRSRHTLPQGRHRRLAAIVIQQGDDLPAEDRLAVLARLPSDLLALGQWAYHWNRAVDEAPLPATTAGRLDRVRLLTAGAQPVANLQPRLEELELPLRTLPQEQRSAAVVAVARMCGHARHASIGQRAWHSLLDLCESLPFHLRRQPLEALQATAAQRTRGVPPRLATVVAATAAERHHWLATHP